jgi:hypothetical protein
MVDFVSPWIGGSTDMYGGSPKVYHPDVKREERGRPMEGNHSAAQDPEARLAVLRTEHRDLDSAIEALRRMAASDDIQLARLKKRKLRLKDEIAQLEDLKIPDIIA